MYVPSAFRVTDPALLLDHMKHFPLAMLVRNGDAGPVIAHIPLAAIRAGDTISKLTGHVAKANPFWTGADGSEVVAVFTGPDAYVSPAYYPSKQEHGKVVPTWNYIRVEVRGRLQLQEDPAKMRPHVDVPTQQMEAERQTPWSTEDAPASYIDKLSHAIIGLTIEIDQIDGVWKLSQNKTEGDFEGVARGLQSDGETQIASAMLDSSTASR